MKPDTLHAIATSAALKKEMAKHDTDEDTPSTRPTLLGVKLIPGRSKFWIVRDRSHVVSATGYTGPSYEVLSTDAVIATYIGQDSSAYAFDDGEVNVTKSDWIAIPPTESDDAMGADTSVFPPTDAGKASAVKEAARRNTEISAWYSAQTPAKSEPRPVAPPAKKTAKTSAPTPTKAKKKTAKK